MKQARSADGAKQAATGDTPDAKAVDRFPELRSMKTTLEEEKAAIEKRAAPLREKRAEVTKERQVLERKEEELRLKIEAIEHPRLVQIDAQIAKLATAMGGRRMSQSMSDAPDGLTS